MLLGHKPPAFDLLYWNNDNTCLPARLHGEFMDLFLDNAMAKPGKLRLARRVWWTCCLGSPRQLTCSVALPTTSRRGRPVTATPSCSAASAPSCWSQRRHIQSILNPPGNKKSEFWTGGANWGLDPRPGAEVAEHHAGSWWPHWHAWLHERSGALKEAPAALGSADYPELSPAPGTYVLG